MLGKRFCFCFQRRKTMDTIKIDKDKIQKRGLLIEGVIVHQTVWPFDLPRIGILKIKVGGGFFVFPGK